MKGDQLADLSPDFELDWRSFRSRPHMYVGAYGLEMLRALILGYNYALHMRRVPARPGDPFQILESPAFHEYVANHFGDTAGSASWVEFIGPNVADPKLAVEKLFQLLDEYQNTQQSGSSRRKT